MSILEELKTLVEGLGIRVETGVFSEPAPDTYVVLTPLTDTFSLYCDNRPSLDINEVRISLFSKSNYLQLKNDLEGSLLDGDFTITDRCYVGYEEDTGYHHYAVDAAKLYEMEEQ